MTQSVCWWPPQPLCPPHPPSFPILVGPVLPRDIGRGWACTSFHPAIKGMPEFKVTGPELEPNSPECSRGPTYMPHPPFLCQRVEVEGLWAETTYCAPFSVPRSLIRCTRGSPSMTS